MSNSWPSPRYDIQQTASTQANPSIPNTRFQHRWHVRRAGKVSGLIIYSDRIFCATKYGSVHAFDIQTGQRQWSIAIDCVQAKITTADDHLFVATDRLRMVDIDDGTVLWEYKPDDSDNYSPASGFAPTVGPQSIIWSMRDRIVVLDKNTGEKHWHKDTSGRVQASAIIDNKMVVSVRRTVTGSTASIEPLIRGRLLSFDLNDGTKLWRKDLDGAVEYSPVTGDDSIFVSYSGGSGNPSDRGLVAIDLAKGTEKWHKHVVGGCPAYGDGVLVLGRTSGIVAINSTDGDLRWETETDVGTHFLKWVVIAGETILVGGKGGIAAVDRESGNVINPNVVMSYNGRLTTYPAVTTNTLAFGTSEGDINMYDCEKYNPVWCSNCGADLMEYESPPFCPNCGEDV